MYNWAMRTTIEIKPEHRARLLELAARKGMKGFSSLVEDALEQYFVAQAQEDAKRAAASRLKGVLNEKDAEVLREEADRIRKQWR
jgi:predicted transcriptional regulator